jgi:hypothetical protein
MKMKSMTPDEVSRLKEALHQTRDNDRVAITMHTGDGSFSGTTTEDIEDAEVVNAIKSVPCHY